MTTIEYEGKRYTFKKEQMITFLILTVVISLVVYYGNQLFWEWTHLMVVEDTVNTINWITEQGWTNLIVDYEKLSSSFKFVIPSRGDIGFENACTGVQAIALFAGVIISTPHTLEKETRKNIWLRKILSLIVSSVIFYVVNILRMVIQLNLYYDGANWNDIHVSISAASSFIAAIIILLMHKWIPEFILSITWTVAEIKKYNTNRKARKVESASTENSNQSNNETIDPEIEPKEKIKE